jgi:DNA (cytosine-5)-methyltransferase 1
MRTVDLFSGCGGLSLGFEKAGFHIIEAYDNWKAAVDTYNENFKHPCKQVDLSGENVTEEIRALEPELIIGGPPCQDFSIAGKGNHNGEKANMTLSYAAIVESVQPRMFLMENVYNIERMAILKNAVQIFKRCGYGLTGRVWDASYMGVPQARRRFVMIGALGEKDDFLLDEIRGGLSMKPMTVREHLGESLGTDFYYMHPRSYARRAIFSIDEPSATIRGVNRPIPVNYRFHHADKVKDLSKVRSLSSLERSLIQTFPQEFKWVGSKTETEQLIGNAVPVNMAYFIARAIRRYTT